MSRAPRSGDAGYARNLSVEAMRAALSQQKAHPDYAKFRQSGVLIDGVWDDNDLGVNDGVCAGLPPPPPL
jgi:hypothetical protein